MRLPRFTIRTLMIATPIVGIALALTIRDPGIMIFVQGLLVATWGSYKIARRVVGGKLDSSDQIFSTVMLTMTVVFVGLVLVYIGMLGAAAGF